MADPNDSNDGAATADAGTDKTPTATIPVVDVQAQINQALTAQQAEFSRQLKAVTGHGDIKELADTQLKEQGRLQELADSHKADALSFKTKFEQAAVSNALLAASADAINSEVVKNLLADKAVVDEKGHVSIDGKPVADVVKQLLIDMPFLAKPQGGTGSGTPQQVAAATTKADESLTATQRLAAAYQSQ